ncbi:MAG: tetratricopeptide repeat protein, partial [Acidobacteriota bacterium]
ELGRAHMGLGRHDDAEAALTHALAIRERRGPSDALAASLSELSVLYRLTSRYAEAAGAAGRAVAIRSTIEGGSEADLATSLDHQALALDELDRLEDAIPLVRQALEIRQKTLGPHHADVAQSLNSLAILHLRSGQFEAAEERLRQSLAIRRKILPAGHANLGQSHYNLAQTYYTLERDDDARRHLQQALIIWRGAESPNLQRLGFASTLLGDLERAQGRHQAAQAAYGEALDLLTSAVGADHGHLITVYEGLAHAHCDQGQLGPARRHFDRSLAIARSLFAEGSTNVRELVASEKRCFDGTRTAGADGSNEDS